MNSAVTTAPSSTTASQAARPEKLFLWTGRGIRTAVIAFFLFDAAIKLPPLQPVIDAMGPLGWSSDPATTRTLGALIIGSILLYAWRPTALIGAILLTAYLGGAIATNARVGSPLFTHTLFGVYLGVLAWAGLWLRDPRVRSLMPLADTSRA